MNWECSTPYGIRGLGRSTDWEIRDDIQLVLNALRHQRFGQGTYQKTPPGPNKCSTPYGIRGLGRRH